jgi:hypothetical protein
VKAGVIAYISSKQVSLLSGQQQYQQYEWFGGKAPRWSARLPSIAEPPIRPPTTVGSVIVVDYATLTLTERHCSVSDSSLSIQADFMLPTLLTAFVEFRAGKVILTW